MVRLLQFLSYVFTAVNCFYDHNTKLFIYENMKEAGLFVCKIMFTVAQYLLKMYQYRY